jgi:CRP-like cAMP-binding protein
VGERGIFGEMALIDGRPRSATALALADTELIPLGEKGFSLLVAYNPAFSLSVLRVMVKHLRSTNKAFEDYGLG